jgi:nitroreductase
MDFFETLARRRSHKEFTGEALSKSEIDRLLAAAIQAPNHKRNQPWRFTVLEQNALASFWQKLEQGLAETLPGKTLEEREAKRKALAAKLPRLGAIIHVTVLGDPLPIRDRENYAAAACAVENMLLASTAMGFGSFWSTGEVFASSFCAQLLGIGPEEKFVGSIWFGRAASEPAAPGFDLRGRVRHWQA